MRAPITSAHINCRCRAIEGGEYATVKLGDVTLQLLKSKLVKEQRTHK